MDYLEFPWWRIWKPYASSDDEHRKRWMSCTFFWT